LTLVNASSEHKTPQMWSHKWCRMFAEVRSNFGQIFTCCRAEHSAELRRLLNFSPSLQVTYLLRPHIVLPPPQLCWGGVLDVV